MNPILIVDDDADFRESLSWLLESAGYDSRGFDSAEAFLREYQGEPACLLLDVRMTGMSGLELQRQLLDKAYQIPVILITGHGDVPMAVAAMKNQAFDFISKPFDDESLLTIIAKAVADIPRRFELQEQLSEARSYWQELSRREQEVAHLVAGGASNKGLAETLGISVKTVEIHRSRVMKKMQADNLAALIQKINLLG
ncbi:response regulator transcription factor [Pseudoteredinibacter isoporae]|uniref:FixJ family two-component response regulator n=1 Tax=Pseudoteredinibacter isoporae TaxID=570281 RepID=A0A7X0MZ05_9GAMM|nr:response regulator [Pseudoteredinibacter isoporae]MBB6522632.1 FixJ family two-component response regulator [Pseudoteredinibacter isoporae]NHO88162.1 response regulator transcription factor [Pseudoteredinibacter isoporae]NIB23507.1 response regulator transcription factor [Pseudoteredinibacter isoporae]